MPETVRPSHPLQSLSDLTPDPQNANRGTPRGRDALADSLRSYGAGRAVLIDQHGAIIAGNKTVEQAKALGIPLRVIKTDGTHLIAVQPTIWISTRILERVPWRWPTTAWANWTSNGTSRR